MTSLRRSQQRWIPAALALCALAAGPLRAEEKKAEAKKAKAPPAVAPAKASEEPQTLRFALSAPLGVEKAREDARAIAALLTKAMARPVAAEVAPAKELPRLLANGLVDAAFVSAMQYAEAAELSKGKASPAAKLVRGGLPFYRSVLFARVGEKGLSLPKDLKGKRLAFVSEGSASGWLLPRLILLSAGLTDADLKRDGKFLGDHAAVCKAVLDKEADAGATISNDRAGGAIAGCAETQGKRAHELRVIATSDPIPNDVVAVRPDLPPEAFAALRNALLALDATPEGKKALADVFLADAFVAADDSDFAMLRSTLK